MHNRIKELRKNLKLSQKAFGENLGFSRDTIANIEGNRIDIRDYFIKSICSVYNVNESWLRDGIGDMFVTDSSSLISELKAQYNLDNFDEKIVCTYISLPNKDREVIKNYLKQLNNS